MQICSQSGCVELARAAGLCLHHYYSDEAKAQRRAVRFTHRPCVICGADLHGRQANTVTCSPRCRTAYHMREERAASMVRRTGRVCVMCGSLITSRAGKAVTCSKLCAAQLQNQKRNADREAAWQARKQPCARCGKEIPSSVRRGARYCSTECRHARNDEYKHNNSPTYMREYLYGIKPEEFSALLDRQGGLCAICRADEAGGKGGWHVDHDHATGKIRGLLCQNCNLMLGNAKDDPARLQAAITYLAK